MVSVPSPAVEVNERLPIDPAGENRKLPAYFFDVEHIYNRSILAETISITAFAERLDTAPAHDVAHEALRSANRRGVRLAQPALAHVENRLGVHLPHRRAPVRTLHVVGIDLQLGLRRDAGLAAQQDVATPAVMHRCAGRREPHRPARGNAPTAAAATPFTAESSAGRGTL